MALTKAKAIKLLQKHNIAFNPAATAEQIIDFWELEEAKILAKKASDEATLKAIAATEQLQNRMTKAEEQSVKILSDAKEAAKDLIEAAKTQHEKFLEKIAAEKEKLKAEKKEKHPADVVAKKVEEIKQTTGSTPVTGIIPSV